MWKRLRQIGKRPRQRSVRIGDRELITEGLNTNFWRDLSHNAMTVSWTTFILASAFGFIVINGFFAALFMLGQHPIANVAEENFIYYFYFSIETLGTVGYGDMHPQSHYGHIVASIEIFTGVGLAAVVTGLIFARFARPQARILFAKVATISLHDGQRVFMLRLANERHNLISDARAKIWFVRRYTTREGRNFRGFVEMPLLRGENPTFMLSWSIFHVIDAQSPLFGYGPKELEEADAGFVVSVTGLDDNSAQSVHSRMNYTFRDLRWNHHYIDILTPSEGRLHFDYSKFHDVEIERSGEEVAPDPAQ